MNNTNSKNMSNGTLLWLAVVFHAEQDCHQNQSPMGIYSHENKGHSHSHALFQFLSIPIPNFVIKSHSHGHLYIILIHSLITQSHNFHLATYDRHVLYGKNLAKFTASATTCSTVKTNFHALSVAHTKNQTLPDTLCRAGFSWWEAWGPAGGRPVPSYYITRDIGGSRSWR